MLKIGTVIRVTYPEYAADILGSIVGQEQLDRWIVQLEQNILFENDSPVLLSLQESDFEVIERAEGN